MVSIDTVEKGLYDWAVLVLGATIPIIWYHENAPRPNKPYVALHLSTINSIGHDFVDGSGNLTGNRDFMLLCQGIGKHSMDYLEALKTSLCKPKIQEFLRSKNIVYVDRLALSCIAEVVDSRYEERNMLDLKFRFAQMDTDLSDIIEKAYLCHDIIDVDLITITQLSVCSMIPPVIIPPVLPDAPVLTDATPENGEVNLTWSSVSEANTYNLYYAEGDTVDKDGTKITGALSPFSLTGLTNDMEYAFAVSSVNEVGESELSNIMTATPVAPPIPDAPVLDSVTVGDVSLTIAWLPVIGAASYNLYWKQGATVTKLDGTKITGVTSPYVKTELTNGIEYAFGVTAVDNNGESILSNVLTGTPVEIPSVELVGWWKGEDNTVDSVNGNSIVWHDYGGGPAYDTGVVNRCFSLLRNTEFSPNYNYLEIPFATNINFGPTSSFTIEGYFKPKGSCKMIGRGVDASSDFRINFSYGSVIIAEQAYGGVNINYDTCYTDETFIKVKVKYSAGTWKLFINDIEITCRVGDTPYFLISDNLINEYGYFIGKDDSSGTKEMMVDEVKIFKGLA